MPQTKPRHLFLCEVVVLDQPHNRKDAVDSFYRSGFGAFLQRHFAELFTKPSQQSFLLLALGFVLSSGRLIKATLAGCPPACCSALREGDGRKEKSRCLALDGKPERHWRTKCCVASPYPSACSLSTYVPAASALRLSSA